MGNTTGSIAGADAHLQGKVVFCLLSFTLKELRGCIQRIELEQEVLDIDIYEILHKFGPFVQVELKCALRET